MLKNQNILACTDFSSYSLLALKAVKDLSPKMQSKVYVVHVLEYPVQWDWSLSQTQLDFFNENLEIELIKNSKKRIESDLVSLDLKADIVVRLGDPFQVIQELINEFDIGLLMLGHKGRGESPIQFGGLASKLLASASIPIFVIKTNLYNIRVAGLLDPNSKMTDIVSFSKDLAMLLNCDLEFISLIFDTGARFFGIGKMGFSTKLLSLTDDERETLLSEVRERIKRVIADDDIKIKVEITVEKKIAYQLNSILAGDHTDTVVMRRHDSNFLEKILIGSETRRMLEIFEGNLLIIPPLY